jgi:hypothetical protein
MRQLQDRVLICGTTSSGQRAGVGRPPLPLLLLLPLLLPLLLLLSLPLTSI